MLTDPKEIEIISKALQKNVADPNRSRDHFYNIFQDFLGKVSFENTSTLDLGPGQYDLGEILRDKGGHCWAMERDPAVIELGNHKGFDVVTGDLKKIDPSMFPLKFDGLFCKFSINAFWFHDDLDKLKNHIDNVCSLLKPGGWAWIAPWNGVPKKAGLSETQIKSVLDAQISYFEANGFSYSELNEKETKRYGVSGTVGNNALFTKST